MKEGGKGGLDMKYIMGVEKKWSHQKYCIRFPLNTNPFPSLISTQNPHKSQLPFLASPFPQLLIPFFFQSPNQNKFSKSKMIDFSRTFCDLHPNELISNFCCKQQCNVGLCATCICSHTESHIQKRTAPEYENIRTTYSKMQESIRGRISAFQQQKTRINSVIETIQGKRRQISEAVAQAKCDTLELVNKFYEAKEKELLRKVQADEKKVGLHNQNRMESLLNLISRDVNTLFASAQDLNSQTFLESFHRIRTQVLGNSLQTQKDISCELDKNEGYETSISINSSFLNEVKNALERSIAVVFGEKRMQQVQQVQQPQQVQPIDSVREGNKSSRVTITNNPNPNQSSNVTVYPRRSQSLTKTSMIAQPRFPQPQQQPQFSHFLTKDSSQPQLQMFNRSSAFMPNNSVQLAPTHPSQNYNSRLQMRGNSSQKMIKENLPIRQNAHHLSQNFMQANFAQLSNQYDLSKKIKKSGLTIFKPSENQQKLSA